MFYILKFRMQRHVKVKHGNEQLRICNCSCTKKYCSKIIPVCHQAKLGNAWICQEYTKPSDRTLNKIVQVPKKNKFLEGPYRMPKIRIVYKSNPMDLRSRLGQKKSIKDRLGKPKEGWYINRFICLLLFMSLYIRSCC